MQPPGMRPSFLRIAQIKHAVAEQAPVKQTPVEQAPVTGMVISGASVFGRFTHSVLLRQSFQSENALEQFNFEKVGLLCKDLFANPCREMLAGELCSPSGNHFKVKTL